MPFANLLKADQRVNTEPGAIATALKSPKIDLELTDAMSS
jgi:hypothetical protein